MAVTRFVENWNNRGGPTRIGEDGYLIREYTRSFQASTNDPQDGKITVENHLITLNLGYGTAYITPNDFDVGAFLKETNIVNDPLDPKVWNVTLKYTSEWKLPNGQRPDQANKDPTFILPSWRFGFNKTQIAVVEDLDGNAIVNSADQPFDQPLFFESNNPTIQITVHKYVFSYPYITTVQDSVNLAPWFGFAAKQVKCAGIDVAQNRLSNNIPYFTLTYNLEVKHDLWNPTRVIDRGFYQYNDDGNLVQIRDKHGTPLSSPALLDGSGHKTTTPFYKEFKLFREVDFQQFLSKVLNIYL